MKQCSKCGETKPLDQYYTHGKTKDRRQSSCKVCCGKIQRPQNLKMNKIYNKKYLDGLHHVYLLPIPNYVGITSSMYLRLRVHERTYGRDITNYRILHSCKSRNDALELEEFLHDLGYNGRHKNNLYK
jgi:hypothetical protein